MIVVLCILCPFSPEQRMCPYSHRKTGTTVIAKTIILMLVLCFVRVKMSVYYSVCSFLLNIKATLTNINTVDTCDCFHESPQVAPQVFAWIFRATKPQLPVTQYNSNTQRSSCWQGARRHALKTHNNDDHVLPDGQLDFSASSSCFFKTYKRVATLYKTHSSFHFVAFSSRFIL